MKNARLGMNIFELLFFVLALFFGFLCGFGAAGLLKTGPALAFGLGAGGAILFPVMLGVVGFESSRDERRRARQEILVTARSALRTTLQQSGDMTAEAIEAEVNRKLPDELLEDAKR